jgi:dTDP-4-amino-4,6-dideoxygalactose transaminase
MTCGQGGMITTSDPVLYEKCYAIVNRGMDSKARHNSYGIIGDNYQLSELAAAVLIPQLETLDELCERREQTMMRLDQALQSLYGLTPQKQFEKTTCRAQMRYSCFYRPGSGTRMARDQLIREARKRGIPLVPGYRCVTNDASLFQAFTDNGEYPAARAAEESVVAIHHPDLLREWEYWDDSLEKLRHVLGMAG